MNPTLVDRIERLTLRLTELDALLADPAVAADIKRYRSLSREQAEAAEIVGLFRRRRGCESDLAAAREILADPATDDPGMEAMAREEIATCEARLEQLDAALQAALLPKDPDDARNAFLEIRAGTGGDESALFAGDLARMYQRYCERQGWRTEILSEHAAEL
ncbi:MAG TPA: PCRF domain-containing protein, partial [Rubrivivax sp.]|nr:PCRF domain-containing protein [Rubrivivax sp.]